MIKLFFPWLPPSTNHIYSSFPLKVNGRTIIKRNLNPEGKRFQRETLAYLVKSFQPALMQFKKNKPYGLYYRFITPTLENKGWPKTTDNRYKKFDASNLLKVLEDVIAEATAVDDSHFMAVMCEKRKGPSEETHIWAWNLEEETCPLHHALII